MLMMPLTQHRDFLELLTLCGISHDSTFESILAATQKRWLVAEPHGHKEGTTYPLDHQERIKELACKLGYVEEISPAQTFYDYGIVLGGQTLTMEPRFAYMDELWQRGKKFGALVFHSGVHIMPDFDANTGSTEAEALRILYRKYHLEEKFPGIPHIFVDIPLVSTADATRNPTTADGVHYWLSLKPRPGSCLIISSQPYIHYQHAVFCSYMPPSFSLETVGPTCADYVRVSDILDSITRHLYQCQDMPFK